MGKTGFLVSAPEEGLLVTILNSFWDLWDTGVAGVPNVVGVCKLSLEVMEIGASLT